MRKWITAGAALVVAASVGLVGWAVGDAPEAAADTKAKPNVIFILADDLSKDLVPYMKNVNKLRRQGTTFSRYSVATSLCCPSRAQILTGQYGHNTNVLTNTNDKGHGGYAQFRDDERNTFAVQLDKAGYYTGFAGKYMNGYDLSRDYHVPPGWDEWHAAGGGGYNQWDYQMANYVKQGGKVTKGFDVYRDGLTDNDPKTGPDHSYNTDVLGKRGVQFLRRAAAHPNQPFFLEVATYAPHGRVGGDKGEPTFPPARRDRPGGEFKHGDCGKGVDCRNVRAPRNQAFDEDTSDKPGWVRDQPLTKEEKQRIDQKFRERVQMVQSLDDMVGKLIDSLDARTAANTYVMFSADNGFHLGQHRLLGGKQTAYDTDILVPLVVRGPGVPAGKTRHELVQNIDLSATFQDMGGAVVAPGDGRSFLPLVKGNDVPWRDVAFLEHTQDEKRTNDPDEDDDDGRWKHSNRKPPTYRAVRTVDELYVEYASGAREYYNMDKDPLQLTNTYDKLAKDRREKLSKAIEQLRNCGKPNQLTCWNAATWGGGGGGGSTPEPSASTSTKPASPEPSPSAVEPSSATANPGDGGGLPLTGVALTGLIGLAAVAIVAGGVMLVATRRRRRNDTTMELPETS